MVVLCELTLCALLDPHLPSQVCVWCWHHIMEMAEKDGKEGRCPVCRTTYDKEKIVGVAANCQKLVQLLEEFLVNV